MKILIVDDASFMRMTIKNHLTKHGYEVVGEAENGLIGVQKFTELKPDIVTMDVTMPEMDGLEALTEIMKLDPKAKVVLITAMGQENVAVKAIQSGAKGFVVKPFKEDVLINAIKRAENL